MLIEIGKLGLAIPKGVLAYIVTLTGRPVFTTTDKPAGTV